MDTYSKKANTSKDYSVKDIDTVGRILSVYWSAFDNKDRDGDVIVKGAFAKTIREQGPKGIAEQWFLKFHNPEMEIATPFELFEDNYGLLARIKMPNTTTANDVLQLYQDGHFKHQSIGYTPIKQQKKPSYNELTELLLREGSVVLWAANPAAKFVDIKSMYTPQEIDDEIVLTLKGIRNGKFQDDTFSMLEIKLLQLMESKLPASTQAAPALEPQNDEVNQKAAQEIHSLIQLFK